MAFFECFRRFKNSVKKIYDVLCGSEHGNTLFTFWSYATLKFSKINDNVLLSLAIPEFKHSYKSWEITITVKFRCQ